MLRHLLIAAFGVVAFSWASVERASSVDGVDWAFEASTAGWIAENATIEVSGPPRSGSGAGRLTATGTSSAHLITAYWLQPIEPGRAATGAVWLAGSAVDFTTVTVALEFLSAAHALVGDEVSPRIALGDKYVSGTVHVAVVPPGATHARIRVKALPKRAGVTLNVDDASITQPIVERTATPTDVARVTSTTTASATSSAAPTASATATGTGTVRPTTTVTSTATASPTVTPSATATTTSLATPTVFGVLTNGDFEDPRRLYGWTAQGGSLEATASSVRSGRAALLTSSSSSTKWLHQAVAVAPGAWYRATASLVTRSPAEEGWLRLAWYGSADGSGAQLEVHDSALAPAGGGTVSVGPAQAPPGALSVRVRLMLRPPSAALAALEADDVTLESVAPPLATPSPSGTPPPAPVADLALPGSVPHRAGGETVGPSLGVTTTGSEAAASAMPDGRVRIGLGGLLRITELLPNPVEPGPDADFEWIELGNVGAEPLSLEGYTLTDNAGAVALPSITLGALEVLLLGSEGAAGRPPLAGHAVHALVGGFSNGLGNAGDRLALAGPDGTVIDAVSWGSDRTFSVGGAEVGAPAPGRSILRRFADDGSLVGTQQLSDPTPGRIDDAAGQFDGADSATRSAAATPASDRGWPLLAGLAALSLCLAGADRLRRMRER